jgi:hypothetical protein
MNYRGTKALAQDLFDLTLIVTMIIYSITIKIKE